MQEVTATNKRWTVRLSEANIQSDALRSELDHTRAELNQLKDDMLGMVCRNMHAHSLGIVCCISSQARISASIVW